MRRLFIISSVILNPKYLSINPFNVLEQIVSVAIYVGKNGFGKVISEYVSVHSRNVVPRSVGYTS